jgi:ankyrin repeat protein
LDEYSINRQNSGFGAESDSPRTKLSLDPLAVEDDLGSDENSIQLEDSDLTDDSASDGSGYDGQSYVEAADWDRQLSRKPTVQFYHPSVQTYFTDAGLAMFPNGPTRLVCHKNLYRCCTKYLEIKELKESLSKTQEDGESRIFRTLPLLRYAIYFWVKHAELDDEMEPSAAPFVEDLSNSGILLTTSSQDPNVERPDFMSPETMSTLLHVAAAKNMENYVQHLLSRGADPNYPAIPNPLLAAVKNNVAIVSQLLSHNADHTVRDPVKETSLLSLSIKISSLEIFRMLLKMSDLTHADKDDKTALVYALTDGARQISSASLMVEQLVDSGADVSNTDKMKRSAWHYAALQRGQPYCEILRRCKESQDQLDMDLHRQDLNNDTPLHLAARAGNGAALKTLLKAGSVWWVLNMRWKTALHEAAESHRMP